MRSVLIIDDDIDFAESLIDLLEPKGYQARHVTSLDQALDALHNPDGEPAAVAMVDVRLGGIASGVDFIPRLQQERPELICVLMTTNLDSPTAIAALRGGAYDYFDKSRDLSSLMAVLDRCFDSVALRHERADAYEAMRVAKETAEAASRGKSAFLATMSHELRTPLNAIIGFSQMMTSDGPATLSVDQYQSYASNILESGTHLLQIVNDILDLSKAEAGKLDLIEDVFDLRETVRSMRQLIGIRITQADLSVVDNLPEDLPLLRADERKTKQMLLNLVGNAVKFTEAGGRIEISGHYDPEIGLTVTVADTGIGIAEADLERVLKPFEQAEASLSRSHQGTGLGLPLVKAIIEMHDGTLGLASEVGVGTRVSVTFPPSRAALDARPPVVRNVA